MMPVTPKEFDGEWSATSFAVTGCQCYQIPTFRTRIEHTFDAMRFMVKTNSDVEMVRRL